MEAAVHRLTALLNQTRTGEGLLNGVRVEDLDTAARTDTNATRGQVHLYTSGSDIIVQVFNGTSWQTVASSITVADVVELMAGVYGEIDNNGTPIATICTDAGTFYPLAGDTVLEFGRRFDMPNAGRIRYIGTPNIIGKAIATLDYTSDTNNHDVTFQLRRNGAITDNTHSITVRKGTASDRNEVTVGGLYPLHTNDYLEVWVSSSQAGVTVTSSNFGLNVIRVGSS